MQSQPRNRTSRQTNMTTYLQDAFLQSLFFHPIKIIRLLSRGKVVGEKRRTAKLFAENFQTRKSRQKKRGIGRRCLVGKIGLNLDLSTETRNGNTKQHSRWDLHGSTKHDTNNSSGEETSQTHASNIIHSSYHSMGPDNQLIFPKPTS